MGLLDRLFGWMRPKAGHVQGPAPARQAPAGPPADFEPSPLQRAVLAGGETPARWLDAALDLRARRLAFHAFHAGDRGYRVFEIPKRDGSARRIEAPCPALKFIQRRILTRILRHVPLDDCVKGFRRRRSIFGNARPHVGQPIVLNLDVKDFFPTISAARVFGLFRSLGFDARQANLLARLTTFQGRLPQGAPTSPAISNLVCRKLDRRLAGLARRLDAQYTRYADDITFSGPESIRSALPLVRRIIAEEGLQVAERKVHVARRCRRQLVTGLTVNEKVSVPRPTRRRLRAILHNAARDGLAAQNRDGRPDFAAWLRGQIEFVRMIDRDLGGRMLEQFRRLRP